MTNLPKKITFAYDYVIKKTTTKPNAPKQKRDHLRQKRTEWSCGDTGHLAFPKGSGVHVGDIGSPWGSSSSLVACPQGQGAEVTAQILNFGALPRGLQHISGTFLELQHSCGMGTPKQIP